MGTLTAGFVNRAIHSDKAAKSLTLMVYLGEVAGLLGIFVDGSSSLAAFLACLRLAPFDFCEGGLG